MTLPSPIDDQMALELHRKDWSPEQIASTCGWELKDVQHALLRLGADWSAPARPGRPQKPLLVGQQLYVERAYTAGVSQTTCAERVRAPLVRVRRHLQAVGLLDQQRATATAVDRAQRLQRAILMYLEDVPVGQIVEATSIRPPALYAALRARRTPLRLK